jgi:hypothetical protein
MFKYLLKLDTSLFAEASAGTTEESTDLLYNAVVLVGWPMFRISVNVDLTVVRIASSSGVLMLKYFSKPLFLMDSLRKAAIAV